MKMAASQPAPSPEPLSRMLLSIDSDPCPFGCTYCFAQFDQYVPPTSLDELEANPERCTSVDILYPACDSDLFARSDFDSILERVAKFGKSVSVSTKAQIGNRAVSALQELRSALASSSAVIKVGISISTKYSVSSIEPRTPGYDARLRSLARLRQEDIPSALILRPLLSDVSDAEYEEILTDCSELTNRVLVGDEWLDQGNRFREARSLAGSSVISQAVVNWLPTKPEWSRRSSPGRVDKIRSVAERLGLALFESDVELMHDVLNRGRKGVDRCRQPM